MSVLFSLVLFSTLTPYFPTDWAQQPDFFLLAFSKAFPYLM